MSTTSRYFTLMIRHLEAIWNPVYSAAPIREGSDEIVVLRNGLPEIEVSSLSLALYQMGLCKHLPDASLPAGHSSIP